MYFDYRYFSKILLRWYQRICIPNDVYTISYTMSQKLLEIEFVFLLSIGLFAQLIARQNNLNLINQNKEL